MPVTRATLITEIRDNLNESTAHQWTDDNLRRWINQGMREITRRTLSEEDTESIATVAGQEEYTLPTDLVMINRVEYFESATDWVYSLEAREFNAMDTVGWAAHQMTDGNRPFVYTVWGYAPNAKLIVFPKPDITSATLKVYYYKFATELTISSGTDSSNLDIPEGWTDLISDYCEYKALRMKRDPRWQEAKQAFEEKIMIMNERTLKHHNQPGQIVPSFYDPFSEWGF